MNKDLPPFGITCSHSIKATVNIFGKGSNCLSLTLTPIQDGVTAYFSLKASLRFCANTIGSFTCTCNAGFEGDGVDCEGSYKIP